jgi:hypothetical protein
MLICGARLLTLSCAGAAVISLVFGQPFGDAFWTAWAILGGFSLLAFAGYWLLGRWAAGGVPLDCGPHPARWLFLLEAFLFLALGLSGAPGCVLARKTHAAAGPLAEILFGLLWLIFATGRLQVREGGIWQYWSLLRWEKIGSYQWASDSTLLVRAKGPFSWCRGALPFPTEHKHAVQEFLAEHCPIQACA